MQRFQSAENACPICGGYDRAQRGRGVRCFGYLSSDGAYAHCTRAESAGGLQPHRGPNGGETFAHRLEGSCKCGVTHGSGGDRPAAVHPIGESRRAEIIATYDYVSPTGELVYQVVRKRPKAFMQRRPDGRGGWLWKLGDVEPLLYRLPEVIAGVAAGDEVYVAEGEKDADALHRAGVVATCNSGGAGKFPAAMARHLRGASVVIVRDNDDAGHKHAQDVFRKLRGAAKSIRVVAARSGKDAYDHLQAGHGLKKLVPVWPPPDREADPVAWKRSVLRSSLSVEEPLRIVTPDQARAMPELPTWPVGLKGAAPNLPNFRGAVVISGSPSAGKSYLAIASSLCAAVWGGWDVLYVAAEQGERQIHERASRYLTHDPPPNWRMVFADFGADLGPLIELVSEHMTERKTLIVFDSISSFVDNASAEVNAADPHGLGALKRLVMWAVNVKRKTFGQVSFLILSELNAQGVSKGRTIDHKADLSIAITSGDESKGEDPACKTIRIVKGWEYPVGLVGHYDLDWRTASLTYIETGADPR